MTSSHFNTFIRFIAIAIVLIQPQVTLSQDQSRFEVIGFPKYSSETLNAKFNVVPHEYLGEFNGTNYFIFKKVYLIPREANEYQEFWLYEFGHDFVPTGRIKKLVNDREFPYSFKIINGHLSYLLDYFDKGSRVQTKRNELDLVKMSDTESTTLFESQSNKSDIWNHQNFHMDNDGLRLQIHTMSLLEIYEFDTENELVHSEIIRLAPDIKINETYRYLTTLKQDEFVYFIFIDEGTNTLIKIDHEGKTYEYDLKLPNNTSPLRYTAHVHTSSISVIGLYGVRKGTSAYSQGVFTLKLPFTSSLPSVDHFRFSNDFIEQFIDASDMPSAQISKCRKNGGLLNLEMEGQFLDDGGFRGYSYRAIDEKGAILQSISPSGDIEWVKCTSFPSIRTSDVDVASDEFRFSTSYSNGQLFFVYNKSLNKQPTFLIEMMVVSEDGRITTQELTDVNDPFQHVVPKIFKLDDGFLIYCQTALMTEYRFLKIRTE